MIVVLLAALASASGSAPASVVDDDAVPFFTRDEPHLDDAFDALERGDPDEALEHAHRAVSDDDDERAVVDYDIGQILIGRARLEQQQLAQQPKKATPAQDPNVPPPPPEAPKLDDALAAFDRAAAVARHPRLVSEARLAAGNASLEMQKLDDAIAHYRKALVADRDNERARRNLQRALELKQQQPPPQDSGGGENDDDDQKKPDDKDGEQGDQQKPGDEQQKDPKSGDQPKDGDEQGEEPKGGKADDEKKNDDEQKQEQPAQPTKKKPTSKEEAKRLLQGVRSRERPLTPMEMRGADKMRPKEGKDW